MIIQYLVHSSSLNLTIIVRYECAAGVDNIHWLMSLPAQLDIAHIDQFSTPTQVYRII